MANQPQLNKAELEELYLKRKLSLSQISILYNCSGTTILRWLEKCSIPRRPAYRKKIHIPKEVLEDMYWNKKMKPKEIANIYGIKNERTIKKRWKNMG